MKLSIPQIQGILDLLVRCGLAVQEEGRYRTGTVSIHLGEGSPMLSKHHTNWRMRAIHDLDNGRPEGHLHYSSVVSIAREDVPKAREILLGAIEEIRRVVKDSKENSVYAYCLDLFEV
ncbi:MAG TPA: DUF4423 domain-containing protein [Bdellovibrionota bacterium]|nr:DUF4423 domain-containing protein [Bdellovibrionota bacterium]